MAFQQPPLFPQPQPQQLQPQPSFPGYGQCNSYFVENHDDDDGSFARAAADRERQRGIAKMRQKALAEELSHNTADEYLEDVLEHMLNMEAETLPDIQSIEIQTEIQWFMRPYLLDFMLEAHHAFQLLPETLHLAVNLLDRYCSRRVVYKRHYQLVGCAALLIASKYGDRKERVPTIRELKSMCCSLYDDDMFTQMEWHVLQTLNWVVGHATPTSFLQIAMTEASFDQELEHMTSFITELALYHKEFIPVRASVMARSALALARCVLGRPQPDVTCWSAQYDTDVVLNLSNHLNHPSQALARKYASPHLSTASKTMEMFLARQAAIAAQAMKTPVNDVNPMMLDGACDSGPYLVPQTPQKPGFPQVPAGVLTPPITPDKFHCPETFSNPRLFPLLPNTSTPPPSAEHRYQYYPSQYLHQPQFVP